MIKSLIKKNFPKLSGYLINIKKNFNNFSRKSYSQFGEDLVLATFVNKKDGFYIDVGAYHPFKFSNTYYYYKKGWSGINIDAKPGSMGIFNKKRKKDINIEVGISKNEENLDFYIFKESAYNTLSEKLANSYINQGIDFDKKVTIKTTKLSSVLDKYLPQDKKIDFISIDAEGFDMEVLESNDWNKYKPNYIVIEMHNANIEEIKESNIYKFLISKKYKLISIVYITLIFKHESSI
ncbi:MAG: FkbM family methyltransferase [Candidatus Paceibacterota bacterium]